MHSLDKYMNREGLLTAFLQSRRLDQITTLQLQQIRAAVVETLDWIGRITVFANDLQFYQLQ